MAQGRASGLSWIYLDLPTTTYTYNNFNQLTEVTDPSPVSKETHYACDSAGRRESVAGGVNGDFDPTEYNYTATTGLLESVVYHHGEASDTAEYFYDGAGRLQRIEDWLGGNGLRYAYDALGRLETLTDYDDSTLTYAYDNAGNVASMTDYHGNQTAYTYDDLNRLYTMTAPGSKTWTFGYNELNQPVLEMLPNGMATIYTYDTKNRLDKIDHKTQPLFGTTVESFDYTLDDDGNITRIDEASGAYWTYTYDNRNRLINGVYTTDWGHQAKYNYTYDDGDNMTQKQEPFAEDFNDGNGTGWSVAGGGGTFSASNYYVVNSLNTTGNSSFYLNRTAQDGEIRFSYLSEDTSSDALNLRVILRNNANKRIDVRFYPSTTKLWEWDGDSWNLLDQEDSADTSEDTWYDVVCKLDGANVSIFRGPKGGALTEILSTTVSESTTNSQLWFLVTPNAMFRFDDVKIIDGTLHSTWTMTPNNANELTQMTNSAQGTTIDFEYDAMGRTTEKALGNNTATYAWRYGSMLHDVESMVPDEGDVTYEYGGDKKRRSRTAGSDFTWYNWDNGWNTISEEDGLGALTRTYIHSLKRSGRATYAHVDGSSPGTGNSAYYVHDHLGSTRALYSATKTLMNKIQYSPYGVLTSTQTPGTAHLYTGHQWDPISQAYYAPYRYVNPRMGRWLNRDPLGMVNGPNAYQYAGSSPINWLDTFGLCCTDSQREACGRCRTTFDDNMDRIRTWYDDRKDDIESGREACEVGAPLACAGSCGISCILAGPFYAACFAACTVTCIAITELACVTVAADLLDAARRTRDKSMEDARGIRDRCLKNNNCDECN